MMATTAPKDDAGGFWYRHRGVLLAFVAGGIGTVIAGAIGALAVVEFGLYDIAATQQHNPIVSWALHKTFKRAVRLRADHQATDPSFSQAQVVIGFQQYQADCMTCHGGPGVARADWVKGLEPTPPFLLDAGDRWTAAQLDYILEKGVKMSAMPSWGATRSPAQIQAIVAFLKALPGISPAEFRRMQHAYPPRAFPEAPPQRSRL